MKFVSFDGRGLVYVPIYVRSMVLRVGGPNFIGTLVSLGMVKCNGGFVKKGIYL